MIVVEWSKAELHFLMQSSELATESNVQIALKKINYSESANNANRV